MRSGTGLAVSAVTWTELLHGAFVGYRDETAVREFAVDFGIEILPVDAAVAGRAAGLQAAYRERVRFSALFLAHPGDAGGDVPTSGLDGVERVWEITFYEDDEGRKPVLEWIKEDGVFP